MRDDVWSVVVEGQDGRLTFDFAEADSALLVWRGLSSAWRQRSLEMTCAAKGDRAVLRAGELRNVHLINPEWKRKAS